MRFLSVTEVNGRQALDSASTTAGVAAPYPHANTGVTCAFRPESNAGKARRVIARVVTRKSTDGGRGSVQVPSWAVELDFSSHTARHGVMLAARVIVTGMSQLASDPTVGASSARR